MTGRIDVHQHLLPEYRDMLRRNGVAQAGGRELPDWSPDAVLELMDTVGIATAILSVSTPGTSFLAELSRALAHRGLVPVHDRGRVLADTAVLVSGSRTAPG